jgi:hypothetical protein
VTHSLLDYERLLFRCDWLGSDLRTGHFFSFRCPLVNTQQLNTELLNWLLSALTTDLLNDGTELSNQVFRLAVYRQSVRLGAKPLETHDQRFFFPQLNSCGHSPYVILSDEKMGLSLMNMLSLSSIVRFAHIACYWKFFLLHYTQVLCQSRLCRAHHASLCTLESESESYITTDGQPASLSCTKALIWGIRPDIYSCQTVAGLLMWSAVSVERTGLSFTVAPGPRQRSHFRVQVPWDSWP